MFTKHIPHNSKDKTMVKQLKETEKWTQHENFLQSLDVLELLLKANKTEIESSIWSHTTPRIFCDPDI